MPINFLSGYKTYLTVAAGIVTEIAMLANGQATTEQALTTIFTLLVGAFIRSGVAAK